IVLSPQEIRALTFAKLEELSSSTGETSKQLAVAKATVNSDENAASNMLILQWPGEVLPKEALVQLKTKSANGTPLFIVHAIEGLIKPLEHVAKELDRPLWGLQSVERAPHDTIQELAEFYIKKIKEVQKKGPYHLAGYSFGTCIAIEMTLQLEYVGENVSLSLIDGS
ncbi:Fatty acid synthase, partial [Camponotus floridanus]